MALVTQKAWIVLWSMSEMDKIVAFKGVGLMDDFEVCEVSMMVL